MFPVPISSVVAFGGGRLHCPPPLGFLASWRLEPECLSFAQLLLTYMPNCLTEKGWPFTGFTMFNILGVLVESLRVS